MFLLLAVFNSHLFVLVFLGTQGHVWGVLLSVQWVSIA